MRRHRASEVLAAVLLVTTVPLAACGTGQRSEGGDGTGTGGTGGSADPTGSAGTEDPDGTGPTEDTESSPDDDAVRVEIEVEEGRVTPTGEQVEVTVSDTVVLEVDSDVADELHVHSAPQEQTFAVRPVDDQRFRVDLQQPGQFDVELHEAGVLVAELVVRP